MAEASAGGSAQCAFQRQLHSVLAAFWLSALTFSRAAGQCSYPVFHGASTLGKWVTSIPALSHGGNHQQPEGLGGRGQIATANEVRLDIHCSCLYPKRVRQDWKGSVYTASLQQGIKIIMYVALWSLYSIALLPRNGKCSKFWSHRISGSGGE